MKPNLALLATLLVASLISFGCASTRTNLVEIGKVDLVVVETTPVKITRAKVLHDESGVVITGKVARERQRAYWLRGHVDLRMTSPDGDVLLEESVRFHRRRLTRHTWEGTFAHRIGSIPPPGTTVRLAHHEGPHSANTLTDLSSSSAALRRSDSHE
ncbi:hypothetical protein HED60_23705 [Planctomycetales bacterium ZRK34]|nr:hypothetical protein HED60_23705 [Planctomycetales bacterium ZRK34]